MDRDADMQLAMDNQGTLGLHDSPLQKHANEFTSQSLIPTLGFLREFQTQHGAKEKRQMDEVEDIDLPKAISMVSATPARTVGLDDRGTIARGLRADIVRVRRPSGVPVVRSVWRQGKRVA